ncbi:MAG: TetR/AcrR family transcriptional regulator [Actinobacteria bacterium]|nr:TetR/AcrR family transcriptional regulator [Actinomycetota bacterium]
MGYRHSEADILAAAVTVAGRDGLAALSFGRVAKELGISDRMVVYYFPSKSDLIMAVVADLGAQLQGVLAEAFGDTPRGPDWLLRRSWPVLASPAADEIFDIFFQAVGLATAGVDPYPDLVNQLLAGWVAWLEPRVAPDGEVGQDQPHSSSQSAALAVMATLDGLLLIRRTLGARAAEDAAHQLGIR